MSKKLAKAFEHLQQGLAHHQAGQVVDALRQYERAAALNPNHGPIHEARGIALSQLRRHDDALKCLNRAAGLSRNSPNVLINRGNILNELGRAAEALADFDQAAVLGASDMMLLYNRGNALAKLDRHDEALKSLEEALALQPATAVMHIGKGVSLAAIGRYEEALESYAVAMQLAPGTPEAHYNRGNALKNLWRMDEALSDFEAAILLDPTRTEYFLGAGSACLETERRDAALEAYDAALALDPDNVDAHVGRAYVLALWRPEEALASLDRALTLRPGNHLSAFQRQSILLANCNWTQLDDLQPKMDLLHQGLIAINPFSLLALYDDPDLHRVCAAAFARTARGGEQIAPPLGAYAGHDRIRLGYFSADFHSHATMHLMAELLEKHDREAFEIVGFSFGSVVEDDPWRLRAMRACDRFEDIRAYKLTDAAAFARSLEIDIAIDLKGYTQHSRPGIFMARAAPLQVNYLGYPGTLSEACFDYIIGDPHVIPDGAERYYSEKVVRLPDSYQCNCAVRTISDQQMTRAEAGLPERGFVYCSFNQNYKIIPDQFALWMRILRAVDESVLWLLVTTDDATRVNLRREASAAGVDPDRLIFAARLPAEEHLARVGLADLFLDTFPCNAHTTASDALRMGLPIVTLAGQSFASRVAASLLSAVGLPELVTQTRDEFCALAIGLANDRTRVTDMRQHLLKNGPTSPLFDSERFTRNIEAAYHAMQSRALRGLAPDHITV